MLCYIYRSTKKDNCYLYLSKQDDFSSLPETLQSIFGKPVFAMSLLLKDDKQYVAGMGKEIRDQIEQDGFFLQMLKEDDFDEWINSKS